MFGKFKLLNLANLVDSLNALLGLQKPIDLNDGSVNGTFITWNVDQGYNSKVLLTGNKTLVLNNLSEGDYGTIKITQDGTGSRTITLPANSKVSGGGSGAVTLSTAAGSVDILSFYYSDGIIYWNLSKDFS